MPRVSGLPIDLPVICRSRQRIIWLALSAGSQVRAPPTSSYPNLGSITNRSLPVGWLGECRNGRIAGGSGKLVGMHFLITRTRLCWPSLGDQHVPLGIDRLG